MLSTKFIAVRFIKDMVGTMIIYKLHDYLEKYIVGMGRSRMIR